MLVGMPLPYRSGRERIEFRAQDGTVWLSLNRIADLFETSDQRHYYVPCPTCGHMQTLEWERLLYSQDLGTVHYQCAGPACDVLRVQHPFIKHFFLGPRGQ